MLIIVFFTDKGTPKTGLTPTIDIWEADDTQIVNAQAMSEISGGFYKYDFSSYDDSKDYCIRADGGTSLSNFDRYKYNTNMIGQVTEDLTDVLADTNEIQSKLPTNNIMGSSVKTDKDDEIDAIKAKTDTIDWTDIEFMIDVIQNKKVLAKSGSTWQLIIYNDAGDTPILTKDIKDKDGNDITDLEAGTLAQELKSSV